MNYRNLALGLFIVIMTYISIVTFAIYMPATYAYNTLFGNHVEMAQQYTTFDGIEGEVRAILTQMDITFKGMDYAHTYSSVISWEKTPDRTLLSQKTYLEGFIARIEEYKEQYTNMQKNQTSVLADWYNTAIDNLRYEIRKGYSLSDQLWGVMMINFYPLAYWAPWYCYIPAFMTLVIGIVYIIGRSDF